MPSPEVHIPVAADLTEQFNSIVDVETPHAEVTPAAPVAGELQNVKTFHPSELPEGALLLPKDPTNPMLPHLGELEPGHVQDTASRLGSVSIAPEADNIVIVKDAHGVQHRLFSVVEPAKIVSWFMTEKGYEFTGLASDEEAEPTRARHALRDTGAAPPETEPEAPTHKPSVEAVVAQPEIEQATLVASEWSWFQPNPYPETDKVVTGSHFPNIREALAGEEVTAEIASEPIPAAETAVPESEKPEPGDWRIAAQRRFEGQPLPLGEQLGGINSVLPVVRALMIRRYGVAPEAIDAAMDETNDPDRWLALFPEPESFRETPTPLFQPFASETRAVVKTALEVAEEWATTHGPVTEEQFDNPGFMARQQKLGEMNSLVTAIKKRPTILDYTELEKTKPAMEPVSEDDTPKTPPNNTLVMPIDRFNQFNGLQPTMVIKPPVTVRMRGWVAQKRAGLIKLASKVFGRGNRQAVSA